jgi:hypothetical protein
MPTVFSRNNSSMESNSIKGSNNNIQRMYTSLHEETSNETDSLNDKQSTNSTIVSTININNRRPHSVGPIPHAVTVDGISEQSISPLKCLNESESIPINNNSTKKIESIDRSRKIDSHLAYLLLYTQPYDYNRVIFSLNIIESLIDLYTLINILLIYTRSYYSKSLENRLNINDMQGNRKVHIRALTLLKRICHDLSSICMENLHINLQLINYLNDLFQKLSFQKTILHLFNTIIEKIYYKQRFNKSKTLTKTIYDFNIEPLYDELTRQYLRELVQLLEEMILLENILHYYQHRPDMNSNQNTIQIFASNILASVTSNNVLLKGDEYSSLPLFQFRQNSDLDFINLITKNNQMNATTNPLRYIDNQPIVNQSLFLTSILQYLKQIDFIENHRLIISLVVRILPHCGSSLKSISSLVIEQICRNLCFVVQTHNQQLQQQQQQQQQQQTNKNKFK